MEFSEQICFEEFLIKFAGGIRGISKKICAQEFQKKFAGPHGAAEPKQFWRRPYPQSDLLERRSVETKKLRLIGNVTR